MSEFPFDIPEPPGPIGSDVRAALQKLKFFERLDDRLCPADVAAPRRQCAHSFANSIRILRDMAVDLNDVQQILTFFRAEGARCDCAVLTKWAEQSRFRTKCEEQGKESPS